MGVNDAAVLESALPVAGNGLNICAGVNIVLWLGRTLIQQWLGTVLQTTVSHPVS